MKLLIVVCLLASAKAAKLQGFEFQNNQDSLGNEYAEVSNSGIISDQELSETQFSGLDTFVQEEPVPIDSQLPLAVRGEDSVPVDSVQYDNSQNTFSGEPSISSGVDNAGANCPEGQVRHYDDSCVTPEVTRKVFVYNAPKINRLARNEAVDVPLPKVEHNIVFIRTDELLARNDPIVVPPPQRKHVIYVLHKESEFGDRRIIEVPAPPPQKPEVVFVNYADGENPTLPDGIDFETALSSAIQAEGRLLGRNANFEFDQVEGTF